MTGQRSRTGTAVVIGGSKGIGRAVANAWAAAGPETHVFSRSEPTGAGAEISEAEHRTTMGVDADLVHLAEPLEHRHQPPVLPLRRVEIDDVVVEVVLAVPRRHRHELGAGRMHENGAQRADLGSHVDAGHAQNLNGVACCRLPVARGVRDRGSRFSWRLRPAAHRQRATGNGQRRFDHRLASA